MPFPEPAGIETAMLNLEEQGWKMASYTEVADANGNSGFLFIRRLNPDDYHEKPEEFWLRPATLAQVPKLRTLQELHEALTPPEHWHAPPHHQ